MGGQTIHGQRCPAGMLFEPITQSCGESSCMECSPFGIQNLPHPTDCYQFIRCTMGNREIATCPSNLMFDRTIGNCNYPHMVYCPGQPVDPTEWPTYPTETWPTETWPTETWPTETWPTETWPPFPTTEPPGGDRPVCRGQVFHAHPYDCNRFFMCLDEVLWEHRCPSSLHWNQLVNACDLPENARCLVGPNPPNPTQPPTDFPTGIPTEPSLIPPTSETTWQTWAADEEQATEVLEK